MAAEITILPYFISIIYSKFVFWLVSENCPNECRSSLTGTFPMSHKTRQTSKSLTSGTCGLSPERCIASTFWPVHPTPQGADDERSETFTPPVRWAEPLLRDVLPVARDDLTRSGQQRTSKLLYRTAKLNNARSASCTEPCRSPTVGAFTQSQRRGPANLNLPNRHVRPVNRAPEMEAKTCPHGAVKLSHGTRPASTTWLFIQYLMPQKANGQRQLSETYTVVTKTTFQEFHRLFFFCHLHLWESIYFLQ